MGNCHPSKNNVNLSFASANNGFLRVTISHVTLCSQNDQGTLTGKIGNIHHLVSIGYSQCIRRHNAMCRDELVADVVENI